MVRHLQYEESGYCSSIAIKEP